MDKDKILRVNNLKVYFPLKRSLIEKIVGAEKTYIKAVDGVSFSIKKGETLAVVGESGCGKTTLGRTLVRLNTPSGGQVLYKGQDIFAEKPQNARKLCKQIQYIFQDPYSSLNPKMSVVETVRRPLEIFNLYEKNEREQRVFQLLNMTGIATNQAYRYPHEFSGGQRQRISIARALAVEPEFVIADEPTSSLDVSIQCQILDLLADLRRELELTILFISHDLGVVNYISDNVVIMYLGHLVESGHTRTVFKHPAHPYTKALLEALPRRGSRRRKRRVKLIGLISSPINPPQGCLLHPRCPFAQPECAERRPVFADIGGGRMAACHFAKEQNFVLTGVGPSAACLEN